ncbi:MAG: TetR/AcrR family transcriptional regulator [Propionibacteriaceae bacterium]|nr:TetR/AcrR family transcriptional regulator [Propionibacteriaceae bacterium]
MPRVTQAHRDQQQARIHAAAERCFAQHGFQATSMDGVIAEAGMSSSTVYRYFPGGKRELVRSVSSHRLGRLAERLAELSRASQPLPISEVFAQVLISLDGDGGFNATARLAINVWAELPRDSELHNDLGSCFQQIGQHALGLAKLWHEAGMIRLAPKDAAAVMLRQALGLMAEEVLWGGADLQQAGRQLEQLLGT